MVYYVQLISTINLLFIKTDEDKRVQITEVPENLYENLSNLLNSKVMVETDLDEGGPYRFRNIVSSP